MKYLKILITTITLATLLSVGSTAADGLSSYSHLKFDIFSSSLVGDACNGLSQVAADGNGCSSGGNTLKSIMSTVVTIMSIVVGMLAIIMIIVAGIKFITSSGDTNAVASARRTLLYAIIGVVIAVLAQLLVHYALNTANTIQTNSFLNSYSQIKNDG